MTLFGVLGPIGNAAIEVEGTVTDGTITETVSESDDADLELSYGGGAQLDANVHVVDFAVLASPLVALGASGLIATSVPTIAGDPSGMWIIDDLDAALEP